MEKNSFSTKKNENEQQQKINANLWNQRCLKFIASDSTKENFVHSVDTNKQKFYFNKNHLVYRNFVWAELTYTKRKFAITNYCLLTFNINLFER